MYILQHMYQYLKTDNNIQMILPANHLTSNVSERCDIKDLLEKNKNMKRCRVSWPRNPTWVWKFGLEMKHRKIVNRAVNLVGFIVMNFLSYPSTFLLQSPSPSGSSCNMKYAWMLEDSLPKLVLSFHHVLPENRILQRFWLSNKCLYLLIYPDSLIFHVYRSQVITIHTNTQY